MKKHQVRSSVAFYVTLYIFLSASVIDAEAQQTTRVPARLGFLSALSGPPVTSSGNVDALHDGLRALGWVEGENIISEYRWAEGKYERLPKLAAELVDLKVDVIVTNASRAAIAAKQATSRIPVVFEVLGDAVGMGLVASLAKPGGNLTGVSGTGPQLSGKQVELIKDVVPRLTRVAVLSNSTSVGTTDAVREMEAAAAAIGVRVQVVDVTEPAKLDGAFATLAKERPDALMVMADAMLASQRPRILRHVEKTRLPAIYVESAWVPNGGLMSYAPSLPDQFRKVAVYVDKILKGAKPADLPVQQPTRFELIINLKAAKQIGLTIPPNVLARADKVIK
jgi:putative tryptophan/tyrosine transport system substrate-binding protein